MMKRSKAGKTGNAMRTTMVLMLCAVGALGMESCGKKKPPPKPAPPPVAPVAPEPVPVSFDTISQEMKTDARVQFAPDLKLEEEDLARAVIGLADALAKGDAEAISRMTSKSTRTVIEGIRELGGFTADSEPEAVRVVFIGKNDDTAGFKMTLEDISKGLSGEKEAMDQFHAKVPPELFKKVGILIVAGLATDGGFDLSNFDPPMTAEKGQKIKEAWEKLRGDSSKTAIVEQIQSLLESGTAVPGLKDAQYMTLIAVQTPKGVELTGWGVEKAFGKWTFTPASTDEKVKKSASEWDGIGLAGFSRDSHAGIQVASAAKEGESANKDNNTEKKPDGTTPEEPKKDEPGEQQQPPREKRTPNGPVKLPGGG